MSLSSFCALPRQGHFERVKHIYGYLLKMKHAMIHFRFEEPEFSNIPEYEHDWESVYTPVHKDIPSDAPEPLGDYVTLTHYVDANLMHDILMVVQFLKFFIYSTKHPNREIPLRQKRLARSLPTCSIYFILYMLVC